MRARARMKAPLAPQPTTGNASPRQRVHREKQQIRRRRRDLEPGDVVGLLDAPDEEEAGQVRQAPPPARPVGDEVQHGGHGRDPDAPGNHPAAA